MSNKSIEKLIETVTALFITTIESQEAKKGKISVVDLITRVNSEDFKTQLEKLGKQKQTVESKLKDENAPKRPMSAYMFFSAKKRPEIKHAQPDLKMTEISKVLGQRWKEVSPESKAKYNKKAEKDKERYNLEMETYIRPSDDVLLIQKINQKKNKVVSTEKKPSKKTDGAPKCAKSSYQFFCVDKRNEVKESFPHYKMSEVSQELRRMWNEDYATDVDREDYIRQSSEDKERYTQEKALWDESVTVQEVSEHEDEIKRDEWYYGEIPSECTYEMLVTVMAKGLIKFRKDYHKNEKVEYDQVIKIMDMWFEHDSNMENQFSYLVKDERYDEFEEAVLEKIKELDVQCKTNKPSKPVKPNKKGTPISFNESGQEVSPIRNALIFFLKKNVKPKVEKLYRMKYWQEENYFNIKYDSLVFKATSQLEAIIKFKDYLNENLRSPVVSDAYADNLLSDIVHGSYEDIEDEDDVDSIFASKDIGEIMEMYRQNIFDNDSLWLEECDD